MQESIVDFPRHQAYEVGALSAASAPEVIPSPKVRFAQLSAMVVIPTDGENSKWLSRHEMRQMQQRLFNDALRMRDLFQNAPPGRVTQDDLYECVGIESLLSEETTQQHLVRKQEHVDAVLSAQRAHQGTTCKIEEISQASMRSSQWAREKAGELAISHVTQF
jgi:hypothetical protein